MSASAKQRTAVLIWVVGLLAYLVAIINRTSLASLGTTAQHHFGIEATALSIFMVLQLTIYAAAQIPVGSMIDRFGSVKIIFGGVLTMALGQTVMAFADSLALGLLARALVGVGDAGIFVSLVRLMAAWMPPQKMPIVTQVTGLVGQSGQFVSVAPLAWLVVNGSWQLGYTSLAVFSFAAAVAVSLLLREFWGGPTLFQTAVLGKRVDPPATENIAAADGRVLDSLGELAPITEPIKVVGASTWKKFAATFAMLRRPGIRLAFWVHFTVAGPANCFLFLWGMPFLVTTQKLSQPAASGIVSLMVAVAMTAGPCIGIFTSRFPHLRVNYAITLALLITAVWGAVLLIPGPAPMWLLIVLVLVTGTGGPSSLVGLEVARSHIHRRQLGLASGFVNAGSFSAGLLMIFLVGFVLDLQGAGSPHTYTPEAFKIAFAAAFGVVLLGVLAMVIERPRAMREIARRRG